MYFWVFALKFLSFLLHSSPLSLPLPPSSLKKNFIWLLICSINYRKSGFWWIVRCSQYLQRRAFARVENKEMKSTLIKKTHRTKCTVRFFLCNRFTTMSISIVCSLSLRSFNTCNTVLSCILAQVIRWNLQKQKRTRQICAAFGCNYNVIFGVVCVWNVSVQNLRISLRLMPTPTVLILFCSPLNARRLKLCKQY